MNRCYSLALLSLVVAACDVPEPAVSQSSALDSLDGKERPEPPMLGAHSARGAAPGGASASSQMTWHNGAIMNSSAVTAIFWGKSWTNLSFVNDKFTGIDSFYFGYGGSNYAVASTEYTGTNGAVGAGVAYNGHRVDPTAAPTR